MLKVYVSPKAEVTEFIAVDVLMQSPADLWHTDIFAQGAGSETWGDEL